LYKDESPLEMPDELVFCLKMEPKAYDGFLQFPEGEQKAYIEWIYAAKTDDTKVKRIAATIEKSLNNLN
jgi:uncharacterized protein YdeI (YjbR/CyaY-like superfamily)